MPDVCTWGVYLMCVHGACVPDMHDMECAWHACMWGVCTWGTCVPGMLEFVCNCLACMYLGLVYLSVESPLAASQDPSNLMLSCGPKTLGQLR